MLTIAPFVSRTLRKFGVDANYRRSAAKSWQIEPACETSCLPTLYDEHDIDRVTGVPTHTSLRYQIGRITRRKTAHPPRHAHLLRDVVMVDGHLFKWKMVQPLADRPLPGVSWRQQREIGCGTLACTEFGNRFFGHWLCDDVPLALSAAGMGEAYGHVGRENRLSPHQTAYTETLCPRVELLDNAVFRELVIFEHAPESHHQRARYDELRRRLCAGRRRRPDHPGVMILRGRSGQRRVLVNEHAVAELAARRGFTVIDAMSASADELVDACMDARILLGIEGSHLAHGFLPLHPGGAVFTLQPPFKFDHFWKERCDCVGAHYAFVVGTTVDEIDFEVDLDKVSRMLDRLEKLVASALVC